MPPTQTTTPQPDTNTKKAPTRHQRKWGNATACPFKSSSSFHATGLVSVRAELEYFPADDPWLKQYLVFGLINQLVLGDPRHHRTQLGANFLDLMLGRQAAARSQRRRTRLVFQDEALCIFAGLNILQALTHGLLGFVGDYARAGHILAIFGIVRNRIIHVGDAAFIDQ